jgi:hypothetical protein
LLITNIHTLPLVPYDKVGKIAPFLSLVRKYCTYRFVRKDKNVYRFKGFDSSLCGGNMSALEQLINAWMEAEHPRVRHMCQSTRGDHILLSFVYEETRELEQRVSAQTQTTLPRYFEDDFVDERPTGGRIPATPPPMH